MSHPDINPIQTRFPRLILPILIIGCCIGANSCHLGSPPSAYINMDTSFRKAQTETKLVALFLIQQHQGSSQEFRSVLDSNPEIQKQLDTSFIVQFLDIHTVKKIRYQSRSLSPLQFFTKIKPAPYDFAVFKEPVTPQLILLAPDGSKIHSEAFLELTTKDDLLYILNRWKVPGN